MRLTSLYINSYNHLNQFKIDFNEPISVLIGENGAGKSSILEVLAKIFSAAFLEEKIGFGFELNYEITSARLDLATSTDSVSNSHIVKLAANAGESIKINADNSILPHEFKIEELSEADKKIVSQFLPDNIVIYYAGYTDHLERICHIHEERQKKEFIKNNYFTKRQLFYFRPAHYSILLFTLFLYEFGDIKDYLRKKLKIVGVDHIEIAVKRPSSSWAKGKSNKELWGAKGPIEQFFNLLGQLANDVNFTNDEDKILLQFNSDASLFHIKNHYGEEKVVFEQLDMLLYEDMLDGIRIIIKIENDKGEEFLVDSDLLSEGEKQIIVIKGLNEILLNENTLYLFDEPDTFLHPTWQSRFMPEVESSLGNLSRSNVIPIQQFVITTHSPQLLSNANPQRSRVHILEGGRVITKTPKYYGRDISNILYELMGVERRNAQVSKKLQELFILIEKENIKKANVALKDLEDLLGSDDPEIIRAKVKLEYLIFNNEKNKKRKRT